MALLEPTIIHPNSTNDEVREYLVNLLQGIDANITEERAREMAEKFYGYGEEALETHESEWRKLFGIPHGSLIFKRLLRFKLEYVDVSYNNFKFHKNTKIYQKDTIWPILRHLYRIFILLLVIRTGNSFFEQGAFSIDKWWNIVAFVYFISYGFAYIITSAKSIDENPSWPKYLNIRPMGECQKSWQSTLGYGD